jgi:hypothetical protein
LVHSFPVKLPALWRQVFPALLIGAVLARTLLWLQGRPFTWPDTLPMMGAAVVMVLAMHYFQPTQAGARGLHVMNTWGVRRWLAWDEVAAVSFGRLYFLHPSMRLKDRAGRSYWIATDTKNLQGLHTLAQSHGGAQHPLVQALETPLYRL